VRRGRKSGIGASLVGDASRRMIGPEPISNPMASL